jgi:hypothetical protein
MNRGNTSQRCNILFTIIIMLLSSCSVIFLEIGIILLPFERKINSISINNINSNEFSYSIYFPDCVYTNINNWNNYTQLLSYVDKYKIGNKLLTNRFPLFGDNYCSIIENYYSIHATLIIFNSMIFFSCVFVAMIIKLNTNRLNFNFRNREIIPV